MWACGVRGAASEITEFINQHFQKNNFQRLCISVAGKAHQSKPNDISLAHGNDLKIFKKTWRQAKIVCWSRLIRGSWLTLLCMFSQIGQAGIATESACLVVDVLLLAKLHSTKWPLRRFDPGNKQRTSQVGFLLSWNGLPGRNHFSEWLWRNYVFFPWNSCKPGVLLQRVKSNTWLISMINKISYLAYLPILPQPPPFSGFRFRFAATRFAKMTLSFETSQRILGLKRDQLWNPDKAIWILLFFCSWMWDSKDLLNQEKHWDITTLVSKFSFASVAGPWTVESASCLS